MNPATFFLRFPIVLVLIAGLAVPRSTAQIPGGTSIVPELFAGELDDVGPQYLLLARPSAQPFELWTDFEITGTSNATLVESNPTFSTITSAQAGARWQSARRPRWGGQWGWEAGVKGQVYRYGYLTGVKQLVNFVEIDRNNFNLVGVHLRADWRREHWVAGLTLRGSTLRSTATQRVFYEEAALEWQLFRQWPLTPSRTLAVGLEGAWRLSSTDSFGLLPGGWNDRAEQGVLVVLDQALGAQWRFQPALRVLASRYTHTGRSRTDWHESGRLSLSRALAPFAELRLSVGYDRRDSSEALIADFQKWDLALGASAQWRF
jgi:lambda repressor-like predicted transcriptional regulator